MSEQEQSLIAAIEGDYSKMSHADLVLTCNMLLRGRDTWRKEAEASKREIEHLNKALTLKLDGMPSGLSAGQSILLENKCADLECELQEAVELLRPASAPEMYHNKEAEIWARRRDAFLARQKGAAS